MADPETAKQLHDAAQQVAEHGSDVASYWPGIGAAFGAAYIYVSRKMGSGRVVEALREEMAATRNTIRTDGVETRKELGDLKTAVAHLAGRVEGIR